MGVIHQTRLALAAVQELQCFTQPGERLSYEGRLDRRMILAFDFHVSHCLLGVALAECICQLLCFCYLQ